MAFVSLAQQRAWKSANRDRVAGHQKAYLAANRPKRRARVAVQKALKTGRLVRVACIVCGAPESDAHHEDYSKRLDVTWLCRAHHMARHAELRSSR